PGRIQTSSPTSGLRLVYRTSLQRGRSAREAKDDRRAGPAGPSPSSFPHLRRDRAVDVLVEPALVRAGVGADRAVRVRDPALLDVGAVAVAVPTLTQVGTGDHVAPVGPG